MLNSEKNKVLIGMAAAVLAFALLTVMTAFGKLLSETYHPVEIGFLRNLVGFLPYAVYIAALPPPTRIEVLTIKERKWGVIARAVLGSINLCVVFGTFSLLPMADGTVLIFTASLFAPIIAYFFLKEQVGIYRWSAVIIGFIGVVIMANPTGDVNLAGVGLGLTAALTIATIQNILRHTGKTERTDTITFYFIFIGIFVLALGMPFVGKMPRIEDIWLILGCAMSGVIAQTLLSYAFKNVETTIVSVLNYSSIIWATALGYFIWGDWPAIYVWIGAGIVIGSNIFIIWREKRLADKKSTESASQPAYKSQ